MIKKKQIHRLLLLIVVLMLNLLQVNTVFGQKNIAVRGIPLTDIIDIDSFEGRNMALQNDGTIWTWSGNEHAKRGPKIPGAISVEVGNLALKSDGTVWTWGSNTYGLIGNGSVAEKTYEPTQVIGLNKVTAIASGGHYHVALTKERVAWVWGDVCMSAMTRSDFTFDESYCSTMPDHSDMDQAYSPGKANVSDVTSIAASTNNVSFVKGDGRVERWGYWNHIRMGKDTTTAIKDVITVSEMSNDYNGAMFMLKKGGFLNYDNREATSIKGGFIKISAARHSSNYNLALHPNGTVWNFEENGSLKQLKGLTAILDIESRLMNSGIALDKKGTVRSWGSSNIELIQTKEPKPITDIKPSTVMKGYTIQFNDSKLPLSSDPFIINGTTFVPLRDIFEAMGAKVSYDAGKITISKDQTKLLLEVYKHEAVINGKKKQLPEPPRYDGGRTFVPLRFITEALGASVNWNLANDTIIIKTPPIKG
ncbi:stalk domain-containing protein [Paenibacillus sp. 2TAB23]|uniref:stalk domain-containing protein n=1 Tax=Paenibacillus sp. 2TAB23 TaxID=3233004 RepID=UPI003F9D113F